MNEPYISSRKYYEFTLEPIYERVPEEKKLELQSVFRYGINNTSYIDHLLEEESYLDGCNYGDSLEMLLMHSDVKSRLHQLTKQEESEGREKRAVFRDTFRKRVDAILERVVAFFPEIDIDQSDNPYAAPLGDPFEGAILPLSSDDTSGSTVARTKMDEAKELYERAIRVARETGASFNE